MMRVRPAAGRPLGAFGKAGPIQGKRSSMTRISRSIAAILIAAPVLGVGAFMPGNGPLVVSPFSASVAQAKDTLYKRLGGYDAIAAVTDSFIGKLLKDHMFDRFFAGISDDSKGRLRQNIVDFFCKAAGGPCYYMGRDMKTAHKGLGVTKEQWDKATAYFGETMKELNVPDQEQKDLVALVTPFEKDIVEKK
jgi:hemoglobin